MPVEIRVPAMGESITEAIVHQWFKKVGDAVAVDEPLLELETDKVAVEVNATAAGVIEEINAEPGSTVSVGAVIGTIKEGAAPVAKPATAKPAARTAPTPAKPTPQPEAKPASDAEVLPAARKLIAEQGLDGQVIAGTGKGGRVTKGDVLDHLRAAPAPAATPTPVLAKPSGPRPEAAREERVRMSQLRKRIAARLKEAQNTAAMLTTFNEVDMSAVMAARARYRDAFEKRHGVRLGFMSFFVKASIVALKDVPACNAEIDGDDLIYKNYYHIGVAVAAPQGLIVPVVRDADQMGFSDIEKTINDLGKRAREGKLKLEELQGGTFTVSNGGIFGSLLSTPILNPPQAAILGMHKIEDRPVVVGGKVEARPMMYLALSYDHRVIDGREAVTALVRIKECLEDPERILLDL